MQPIILDIQNVSKTFFKSILDKRGRKSQEVNQVINSLSLQVSRGLVSAIIGGNGTGKSTLFNLICRYADCDKGEIFLYANEKKISLNQRSAFETARLGIGRMFQGTHIFQELTVLENMLVADGNRAGENFFSPLFRYNTIKLLEKKRKEKAFHIFDELLGEGNDLLRLESKEAGLLSYGQQRLLGMARLLMNDSYSLILLDEPCAGINNDVIESVKNIIIRLKTMGKSILLIEHNMGFVRRVSDECFFMDDGRITYSGSPSYLLSIPDLKKDYFGMLD